MSLLLWCRRPSLWLTSASPTPRSTWAVLERGGVADVGVASEDNSLEAEDFQKSAAANRSAAMPVCASSSMTILRAPPRSFQMSLLAARSIRRLAHTHTTVKEGRVVEMH